MPKWHFLILVVAIVPPLQMGKLRLSTAVSACFLDLGAGGSEREGTQPCCRRGAPVGGWQQRAWETEPCPRFPLLRFQLPPQVVNRRPLFKPVTAGGQGGVCLPTGHLAGRGPEVHGPVWEGGYQAGRSPSPKAGGLPTIGAPKCFTNNGMKLKNFIHCPSRWDDGGLSLSAQW